MPTTLDKDLGIKPNRRYIISDQEGNPTQILDVPQSRFDHWIKQFRLMREAGIRIPAPIDHDRAALPFRVDNTSNPAKPSGNNAGYWSDLYEKDGRLFGTLEVEDDASSKAGKSIKEVSPWIKPKHTDSSGKVWDDAIMHIALCQHPVIHGQTNFTPAGESSIVLGFSLSQGTMLAHLPNPGKQEDPGTGSSDGVPTAATGATLPDAVTVLRKVGLDLPDDTTAENLIERIVIAGRQFVSMNNTEENPMTQTPPGAETKEPGAVAMSFAQIEVLLSGGFVTKDKADELRKTGFDPNKLKPIATAKALGADWKVQEAPPDEKSFLLSFATAGHKKSYLERIAALVSSGRIPQKAADEQLLPLLEGITLSFGKDGKPETTALDPVLTTLEMTPSMVARQSDVMLGTAVEHPDGWDGADVELTDAEADKVVDEQFRNSGIPVEA